MTLTVYESLEQGTDEWLEARRGLVTASTMNRLVTSTLKTADNDTSRALLNTLACERITGHVEGYFETFDMARGHNEEPFAREEYAAHKGVEVAQIGFMTRDLNGATLGFSPDGLVNDDGLIEIKCPQPKEHLRTILAGKPPTHYQAQLQVGLFVSGREWIDYVSYVQGMRLWGQRVTPDPAWFRAISEATLAAETSIKNIIATYEQATEGYPLAERRPDLEEMRF